MKPKTLTLFNIGPFTTKTTINFDSLGNMFLISGNTGSGKTTILDAITYALYGSLPGSRGSLGPKTLYSHFAKDDETSFVELTFLLHGIEYKVYREPPRPYVKRNNTLGLTDDSVDFFEIQNGIETKFSGTKTEINQKLISLLTLTKEEFTRIVLLPQGEFATFLKQSSLEKEKTLSKLFPSEYYSNLVSRVEQKKDEIESEYKLQESKMLNLQDRFDIATFENDFNNLQQDIKLLETKKTENSENIKKTTEEKATKTAELNQANKHLQYKNELEQLNLEHSKIQEYTLRLETNNKAKVLVPLLESKKMTEEKAIKAKTELENSEQNLNTTKIQFETAEKNALQINKLSDFLTESKIKLESLSKCKQSFTELQEQQKINLQSEQKLLETEALLQSITNELQELKSQQNKNNLLKSELPELLETKQILQNKIDAFSEYLDLAKLQGSLSAETEKILQEFNSAQSDFLQTEKFLNELKAQNIALQLSPNLKQGEPCPVCGSTEHPVLAHAKSDSLTIAEKINLMSENLLSSKKNFDFASAEKTKIEERTAILTENLKKATVILLEELENVKNLQNIKNSQKLENIDIADLDLVSNVCSELQNQKNSVIEQIEQINAKTLQFNNLDESISQKEKQSSILEQNIPSYKSAFEVSKTMIQNLTLEIQKFVGEQEFSAISIDSEYQKTKNDVLNTESTILNLQTEQKNASTEYTKAVSDNQNSSQFFAERQSEAEQAKKTFETAIKESVFGSEDFVTMAILTESQEQTLQNAVSAWNEKFTSLKALISNSKIDYTTELFEQLNNQVEHFSSKLILLQSEQDEILNNLTNAKSKLDELVALKEQYDSIYAKKSQIQQNYELHLRLSNALSGTNPKKTTFDAWYLSLFLDEIAQNASQRLYQMSGRFKMRLGNSSKKQGYKGLDLEIFDCATGVYCSTESLSGGETFMASLSLALALTDTVQSKKGGVQLDCLFIDEGFGSLDGTKLDNAIKILDEIRENRIVGIISHVSELKNQMQNILEVVKQPQGNSTVRTSLQTL